MNHLGVHWTSELYGCDAALLDDVERIAVFMLEAARVAGATVVSSDFHHFAPHGVSGVVVIAESHLAIHTWPELGYVALDVFTCGDALQAEEAFRWLAGRFHATRVESLRQVRGDPRRIETFRRTLNYRPLHPALFRYDAAFAARFLEVGEVDELAEQVYEFALFTPEFCALLVEECEHHGAWVAVRPATRVAPAAAIDGAGEPDATLTWEALPGLETMYRAVIEGHVRPVLESLWPTWRLTRWDPPATRRQGPGGAVGAGSPPDTEVVAMVGPLNDAFAGGGTHFPRWHLTVGQGGAVRVGSVVVFPGGVSHEHIDRPVTAGRRYTLVDSFR